MTSSAPSVPSSAARRDPGLRPEADVLLCVASPMEEPRRLACLQALTEQHLDWDFLLEAAAHNEMLPLLYWHLNAACPHRVPTSVMGFLRKSFFQISVRNLVLTRELVRLLELLRRHGIQAVPFKGPLLAQSLYGNVALRFAVDLDILVRSHDLELTKRLLFEEGYRARWEMSDEQQLAHLESEYHFAFHCQEKEIHVEVHWGFMPKYGGCVDASYIWDQLTTHDLAGHLTLALRPDDLFVLLCIHGSKHDWKRLKWITDLGRMIDMHGSMDWSGVLMRARSLGQERSLLQGCCLAESLLGVKLPAEIRSVLTSDASFGARAALIRGRLFRRGQGLPGFREWCAYVDAVSGSSTERGVSSRIRRHVRYFAAVMTPEFNDRYYLQLSDWLSFLGYFYRPVRLLGAHGSALFRRLR
jgi:hypothetical protein